ncbi:MAG: helix-turn-helix domain-containing protein [bacterium]
MTVKQQEYMFMEQTGIGVLREILSRLVMKLRETEDGRLYAQLMDSLDCCIVEYALETGGNQVAAAELLGISRNTLRRKIRKYNIVNTRSFRRTRRMDEMAVGSGGSPQGSEGTR